VCIDFQEKSGEFDWDTKQQSLILGSFYWSYILIMVPGGLVAEKYGGKLVYGGGNLVLCLMGLAIPIAARINVTALIFVRLVQGLAAVSSLKFHAQWLYFNFIIFFLFYSLFWSGIF
jgi:MFS family permease